MRIADAEMVEKIRADLIEKYDNFTDISIEDQNVLIIAEIQKGIEKAKIKK